MQVADEIVRWHARQNLEVLRLMATEVSLLLLEFRQKLVKDESPFLVRRNLPQLRRFLRGL